MYLAQLPHRRVSSGKGEEILDKAGGAQGLTMDKTQILLDVVRQVSLHEQLRKADNAGQGVVKLVSHAGGNLANGGQLAGQHELLLHSFAFSDVPGNVDGAYYLACPIKYGRCCLLQMNLSLRVKVFYRSRLPGPQCLLNRATRHKLICPVYDLIAAPANELFWFLPIGMGKSPIHTHQLAILVNDRN